ncbi:MAG: type II secretion system F family protein [Candidatus Omnitrophica bacterium]|nr:type II secretion system F family protein [Candidatus Omnitrophota bacterium]
MLFKYKAKKNLNEVVEGKIDGDSVEQVLGKLQAEGLVPIYVEPNSQDVPPVQAQNQPKKDFGRWQLKQLVLFTQKLYNLVNCRVELLSALRLLEKDCRNPAEKALIGDIVKNIKDGVPFSSALSRYPQYFPAIYINILRAGEATGRLKEALLQLLDYLRRIEDLKTKVKQALAYPIFMVVVGIGTIFVMLTFVLPRIAGMFEDFQAELPLPTRILLGISDFIKAHWFFILLFVFVLVFILGRKGGKGIFSRIKYRIPIAKDIIYKQAVANFSRSTSLLLQGGVNLLSALNDAIPLIDNPLYIKQLYQVRRDISEGKSFSDALAQFKIFPDFFVQMIRVGEEGGRLDSVLADIAESYEKEIEGDLKVVSALIEPAIILFLGLIIGAMVIAMLLPIFNMNTILGG